MPGGGRVRGSVLGRRGVAAADVAALRAAAQVHPPARSGRLASQSAQPVPLGGRPGRFRRSTSASALARRSQRQHSRRTRRGRASRRTASRLATDPAADSRCVLVDAGNRADAGDVGHRAEPSVGGLARPSPRTRGRAAGAVAASPARRADRSRRRAGSGRLASHWKAYWRSGDHAPLDAPTSEGARARWPMRSASLGRRGDSPAHPRLTSTS